MAGEYFWHVTVNTGDARQSDRSEVDPAALDDARAMIARALDYPETIPTPTGQCILSATGVGPVLMVTATAADARAIVTVVVCLKSRASPRAWDMALRHVPDTPLGPREWPDAPWLASIVWPGATPAEAVWSGDMARCLAWAFRDP